MSHPKANTNDSFIILSELKIVLSVYSSFLAVKGVLILEDKKV